MNPSFVLKEVWEGMRGNLSMFFSIILVTFVSLSFVATAALLQVQIGNLKNFWYDKAQLVIYLCNEYSPDSECPTGTITENEQAAIEGQLASAALKPYVETFFFETQQEAYDRLLTENADLPAAQFLTPEQLNSAYWVSLADPAKAGLVVEAFSDQPGVAVVQCRNFGGRSGCGRNAV